MNRIDFCGVFLVDRFDHFGTVIALLTSYEP